MMRQRIPRWEQNDSSKLRGKESLEKYMGVMENQKQHGWKSYGHVPLAERKENSSSSSQMLNQRWKIRSSKSVKSVLCCSFCLYPFVSVQTLKSRVFDSNIQYNNLSYQGEANICQRQLSEEQKDKKFIGPIANEGELIKSYQNSWMHLSSSERGDGSGKKSSCNFNEGEYQIPREPKFSKVLGSEQIIVEFAQIDGEEAIKIIILNYRLQQKLVVYLLKSSLDEDGDTPIRQIKSVYLLLLQMLEHQQKNLQNVMQIEEGRLKLHMSGKYKPIYFSVKTESFRLEVATKSDLIKQVEELKQLKRSVCAQCSAFQQRMSQSYQSYLRKLETKCEQYEQRMRVIYQFYEEKARSVLEIKGEKEIQQFRVRFQKQFKFYRQNVMAFEEGFKKQLIECEWNIRQNEINIGLLSEKVVDLKRQMELMDDRFQLDKLQRQRQTDLRKQVIDMQMMALRQTLSNLTCVGKDGGESRRGVQVGAAEQKSVILAEEEQMMQTVYILKRRIEQTQYDSR